jgi:poly(A) polymerase
VIDHVGGRADLERRVLRTIGNPEVRLREDPVRILRAIRFAARLGLEIEPQTYAAMEGAVEDLPRCASARLLEEVLRLLRGGASQRSLELMDALGALKLLLPPIHDYLQRTGDPGRRALFERLRALDARIGASPLDDSLIMAALLWPLAREVHEKDGADLSAGQAVDTLLEQMVHTARLPRRIADRTRQLLWAQTVLLGERKRRRSLASFRRHPLYRDALQVLQIGVEATGEARETLERWTTGETHDGAQAPREGEQGRRRKRHRGGRGRKRRRTGGQADLPPAQSLG